MRRLYLLIVISCLFAVSCTQESAIVKKGGAYRTPERIGAVNKKQRVSNKSVKSAIPSGYASGETSLNTGRNIVYAPVIFPSFKSSANHAPKSAKVERINGKIKISVENMPLNEFINLVFGKTLKVSYFLDNRVKRRKDLITIKMEKPVPYSEFMDMVEAILSRYGVSVQKKGPTLFIVPGRFAQQVRVRQFFIGRRIPEDISGTETVAIIIPFYYVNAGTYRGVIKRLALSPKAQEGVIPNTNSLMITDRVSNLREAIKIINLFDRLTFQRRSVVIMHLNYLSPSAFINKLKSVLPFEGIPIAIRLNQPGVILIPMPEISSIIIVTPKKEWVKIIEFWRDKLDTVMALGSQPRFFVYYPKNRRAVDLARVFSHIGGSILKGKNKKGKTSGSASRVKVVVDEGRNALVILAPPSQYEQIKNVLDKLDTLPQEVLVQVTIAEVTLTDKLQYGIEWYLRHSGKFSGTLQTIGGLGLGASGINYSLITDTGKFQALLNAYARKNLINVISSPRLVVLDNHNATINVGTQVPVVTSETNSNNIQTQGTTSLLRTIAYRNTGVILTIKPTINSGDILTLTIHQEVSEPQVNDTSKIDSPLILNRSISTSVVLKSGTTLLLGGLIKKNKSSTVNKVPLLGDIPIIGNLFKTTSRGTTKTELIIEITPYIISNMEEAQERTRHFESLMKWFKDNSLNGM